MQVSHGCVRLYPEDIENLFPQIPVGTPGEFTYQTVKLGRLGGQVYVEAHEDIYGKTPAIFHDAMATLQRRGVGGVDTGKLERGLDESGGIPFPVTRGASDAGQSAHRTGDDGAANSHQGQARDG